MPVKIHGKDYKTVAERLSEFHADHKENRSIITEIIQFKDGVWTLGHGMESIYLIHICY